MNYAVICFIATQPALYGDKDKIKGYMYPMLSAKFILIYFTRWYRLFT